MSEDLTSLLSSLQVLCFSREAVCVAANQPMPIKQAKKKTCIRPCDRNNSTQIL